MIEFKHGDCLRLMKDIKSESVDCILTDPPYKYLKNQKLEVDFDEKVFFNEAKRVLKKSGFIVLFGRGTSFYRWNTILADLKFVFKEEVVWDKLQTSSPMNSLMRCHEIITIHTKRNGLIRKIKRPIDQAYKYEPEKIIQSIYRLETTFGNNKTFDLVKKYFETGIALHNEGKNRKFNTTLQSDILKRNRTLQFCVSMVDGITEKSIMKETRDYYDSIHPTQKPVRLIERLISLTTKEGDLIIDPFAGSFATGVACYNTDRDCILMEIDQEYFDNGSERMKAVMSVPKQKQISFADEGN